MTRSAVRRRRFLIAACLFGSGVSLAPRPAVADLRPEELVLLVNRNEPAGLELAHLYARLRHVPDDRILQLDLPTGDEIPSKDYARVVVPAVRAFLHEKGLERQARCLVPFYGVPLKITGRTNTPAEAAELVNVRTLIDQLPDRIRPAVEAVEALAKRLDPTFVPKTAAKLDDLDQRWVAAGRDIVTQLQTIPDPVHRKELTGEFFLAAAPLEGGGAKLQAAQAALELHPDRARTDGPALQADLAAYQRAVAEAGACEQSQEDALARARLRKIVEDHFGLLKYAQMLRGQADYLDERHGGQAFDSELALVEWLVHQHNFPGGSPYAGDSAAPRQRWFTNPLNYAWAFVPRAPQPPTLMVTRLDAPTPDLVREMIATSVRVEQAGLHGKIVIDSLGAKPNMDPDGKPGYGPYDHMMRDLHDMLANKPGVDMVFDAKPEVLPAHSVSDVALYCGWYSVGEYVPACAFTPGAVAMHIASYAMTTLHGPLTGGEWAGDMLKDGAAATVGPVAEPFLFAFPRPDEFYPLLLTGKLTLAEVYWRTEAVASWQMCCVGDPLYNPYKADPVLTVADLPLRLRGIFSPGTIVTTAPASGVKGTPPAGR